MSKEYIELNKINEIIKKCYNEPEYWHTGETFYAGISAVEGEVICLQPADVREVQHGRLEDIVCFGEGNCFGRCSVCKTAHTASNSTALKMSYKYCRWCGAKLDGKDEC